LRTLGAKRDGRAPSTGLGGRVAVRLDKAGARQDCTDGLTLHSYAAPVNDAEGAQA